jgi:hypothetical protein
MDSGLDGGKPTGDGWDGADVFVACGEVIQRGPGETFGGGELGGVPMRNRGELIIGHLPGGIERQPIVGPGLRSVGSCIDPARLSVTSRAVSSATMSRASGSERASRSSLVTTRVSPNSRELHQAGEKPQIAC